jgi:hypothetical protein
MFANLGAKLMWQIQNGDSVLKKRGLWAWCAPPPS